MHETNLNKTTVDNLIDANTNFEDLIENIFKDYLEEILNNHKLLSNSYDDENLHQMRVSLRKFKSFLSFIKNDIPKKEWKYANTLYKNLIKPTSKARDYDVFKSEYLHPNYTHNKKVGESQEIYEVFESKLKSLHENIESHLASNQYLNDLEKLSDWATHYRWKKKLSKFRKCKGEELIALVNRMVQQKYKSITKYKKHVLNFNRKELHRYRVDIKELRYTLEALEPYIEHGKKEAKLLKNMQEILGKINDTYTAENVVQELNLSNNHARPRPSIEQRAFDQRHRYFVQLANIK